MQATTADCESQSAHPIKKKRKMVSKINTDDDKKMEIAFDILQKTAMKSDFNNDELASYGTFIANKLRKYNEGTKNYVQHLISNILFSADQGEFNYPRGYSQHYRDNYRNETSRGYNTASTSNESFVSQNRSCDSNTDRIFSIEETIAAATSNEVRGPSRAGEADTDGGDTQDSSNFDMMSHISDYLNDLN